MKESKWLPKSIALNLFVIYMENGLLFHRSGREINILFFFVQNESLISRHCEFQNGKVGAYVNVRRDVLSPGIHEIAS